MCRSKGLKGAQQPRKEVKESQVIIQVGGRCSDGCIGGVHASWAD